MSLLARASTTMVIAALALALFAQTSVGTADVIYFDPDGSAVTNSTLNVATFDVGVGNAVFKGLGAINASMSNQSFDFLFQAKINRLLDGGSIVQTVPGLNGAAGGPAFELTVVFGVSEVANNHPTLGTVKQYAKAASPSVNYFRMYYDNNPLTFVSDLAGTGYDDGTLILSGAFNALTGTYSIITGSGNLDGFGTNNYVGTTSLRTSGGWNSSVGSLAGDSSFFVTMPALIASIPFNGNGVSPFTTVNPSAIFQPNIANYTPVTGSVNGSGTDFRNQQDPNATFVLAPEPSSMVLLGLGVMAGGVFARAARGRRQK